MYMDEIIGNLIQNVASTMDKILEDAFLEHFGFSILEVADKENLVHSTYEGNPIETFSYKNEPFLCITKEDPQFSQDSDMYHLTSTINYKFL